MNTLAPVYGDVVTIARALGAYRIHGANMWTSDGMDQSRLPYRIQHRRREVAFMRAHAERAGVAVPDGDVLDYELPFLNYRMMAQKLGLPYEGGDAESPLALLRRAVRAVRSERLGARRSAAHLAWFAALALAPRPLARRLIRLRFNRGALLQPLRERLQPFRRRLARLRTGWGNVA